MRALRLSTALALGIAAAIIAAVLSMQIPVLDEVLAWSWLPALAG